MLDSRCLLRVSVIKQIVLVASLATVVLKSLMFTTRGRMILVKN